ncbi:MAG: hypothetical protein GEU82_15500 [Luteitalea sp.]|nr:hypothetical protein [Luteitalea sp.]
MAIVDLTFHPFTYVTIAELAEYWRLRKQRVLEHINAGDVEAIKLGPGIYRVRTSTALAFEARSAVPPSCPAPLVTWLRGCLPSTPIDKRPPDPASCEALNRLRPRRVEGSDDTQ